MAHTSRMRLGVLLLAAVLAGCGGTATPNADKREGSPSPSASDPAVGAYRLTTTITKSTIPDNKPGQKLASSLFLTCADDACTGLFQRAATRRWQGGTVRLATGPKSLEGSHVRTGKCPADGGPFKEAFAWSWKRTGEALTGTVVQTFTGCKLDGSTSYVARAVRDRSTALPYLDARNSEVAIEALNEYDGTVRWVYDTYARCNAIKAHVDRKPCFKRLYDRWAPTVSPLEEVFGPLADKARSSCRTALDALDLKAFGDRLAAAQGAFARNQLQGTDADKQNNAVVKITTRQHELLVDIALVCVPPERLQRLGKDGSLAMDVLSLVPPGDA